MTYPTPEQSGPQGYPGTVPGAPVQNPHPGQGYPAQPQQLAPQQSMPQQFAAPAGGAPAKSPFAAITVRDYAMDAIALTLLIISLFLPWRVSANVYGDANGLAAGRIDVLLVTIVSMLSLGLTYVWRAGVFGPSWNYRKMQDVRLLANVPFLVVFLVYLIMEMLSTRVLGTALAFGLAGALLAATPRQAELGDAQADAGRDKRWLYALLALTGIVVLTTLIQIVKLLVANSGSAIPPLYIVSIVLLGIITPALFVVVALKILQKSQTWRFVGVGIGLAGLLLGFIAMGAPARVSASFYGSSPVFTAVFWMAFGAIAAAPSLGRLVTTEPALQKWQSVAMAAMKLVLAGAAVMAAVSLVNLIRVLMGDAASRYYYNESAVPWVLTLVFSVVAIAGFFITATALKNGTKQGQQLGTAYAGLLFVLYLVLMIIGGNTPTWTLMGPAVVLAFVLPVAIGVILWAPKAMREHFGTLPSSAAVPTGFSFDGGSPAQAAYHQQVPGQQFPQAPVAAAQQGVPPHSQGAQAVNMDQILAEAAHPATSPARLYELAASFPQTHAAIAVHPAVYPGLSDWLAAQGTLPAAVELPAAEAAQETELAKKAEPAKETFDALGEEADSSVTNVVRREVVAEPTQGDSVMAALLAEAANPATAPIRLQELAVQYPQTHAALNSNPATYQGLRDWLAVQSTAAQPTIYQQASTSLEALQAAVADSIGETVSVQRPVAAPELAESPVVHPLAAEAANPATSPTRLHELAATEPGLHAAIAGNPAAYPQLLEWLAGINGPGVAEALQKR